MCSCVRVCRHELDHEHAQLWPCETTKFNSCRYLEAGEGRCHPGTHYQYCSCMTPLHSLICALAVSPQDLTHGAVSHVEFDLHMLF